MSEPPRGIITPRQTAGLLACAAAARPDLIPYLALGFFAGIRPDELGRLRGGRIGAEYILLDGSVTKTRDTRSVEIRPNLRAWLDAHPPPPEKPVAPLSRRRLYDALPRELYEAAAIDGAKEWQIFLRITLPMTTPILAVNALNAFVHAYNSWEWALLVCQRQSHWTLAVWMYQMSQQLADQPWAVMAGFVLVSIPTAVVFIACQKIILRGIVLPSMK